jgi:hypothetical protein
MGPHVGAYVVTGTITSTAIRAPLGWLGAHVLPIQASAPS